MFRICAQSAFVTRQLPLEGIKFSNNSITRTTLDLIGLNAYDKRGNFGDALGRNRNSINDCMQQNGSFLTCLRPYE